MPRSSGQVIACEFDAINFQGVTMQGAFVSARRHPQHWRVLIRCHTLVDGQEIIDNLTLYTPGALLVSALCDWIKAEVRALGHTSAYSLRIRAEVVTVEQSRRFQKKLVDVPTIYT